MLGIRRKGEPGFSVPKNLMLEWEGRAKTHMHINYARQNIMSYDKGKKVLSFGKKSHNQVTEGKGSQRLN